MPSYSSYVAYRKALPLWNYLQELSRDLTKFSGHRRIASKIGLKRYHHVRMAPDRLMTSLSYPLTLSLRVAHLQAIFIPLLLTAPMLADAKLRRTWYRLVVRCLRIGGPSLIKLGQWAATRPDILPLDLCQTLSSLHSRAPEHSLAWSAYSVRRSFGMDMEELFTSFDPHPIGSGSVAQVHTAVLRDSGQTVAVKILHPGVEHLFDTDLRILNAMAKLANTLPWLSWLHLPEELAYFSASMRQQLDLRFEGYTLARFRRNFLRDPLVGFPAPILASKEVLIESFESGLPISFFSRNTPSDPTLLPTWDRLKAQIGGQGLRSFLKMILWDNFVHADLHPGNMLVAFPSAGGVISGADEASRLFAAGHAPRVIFLDTGLVTELSRRDFANFTDLFKAIVLHGDGRLAARLIIERGPSRDSGDVVDPEGFSSAVGEMVDGLFSDKTATLVHLSTFSFSPILLRMFDLVRGHHVRLEGAFTNLIMSLICLEGLGRELSPDLNLRPYLLRAGMQYLATNIAQTVAETVEPYI